LKRDSQKGVGGEGVDGEKEGEKKGYNKIAASVGIWKTKATYCGGLAKKR